MGMAQLAMMDSASGPWVRKSPSERRRSLTAMLSLTPGVSSMAATGSVALEVSDDAFAAHHPGEDADAERGAADGHEEFRIGSLQRGREDGFLQCLSAQAGRVESARQGSCGGSGDVAGENTRAVQAAEEAAMGVDAEKRRAEREADSGIRGRWR